MRVMDPFAHLSYRSSSDHQAMSRAGVTIVLEPCTWPGQPRTAAEGIRDHFAGLVGFERARAGQFGMRHFTALALSPREANNPDLAPPVISLLASFLAKDGVLALGETGYDSMSEAEEACFEWQLDLAKRFRLPVLVRVPAAERARGVRRALDVLKNAKLPEGTALIGPNDEETLPMVLSAGWWGGMTPAIRSRMDLSRIADLVRRRITARVVVGSGADWDLSDPLAVPALAALLRQVGLTEGTVSQLLWRNPLAFLAQSGRLPDDLKREVATTALPAAVGR